jgi:hypothetical protein
LRISVKEAPLKVNGMTRDAYIVAGAIFLVLALVIAFVPIPKVLDTPTVATGDIPKYLPAEGTEAFVFEGQPYQAVGTGMIDLKYGKEYGTLWVNEKDGRWVVVTMRGQVIGSGMNDLPEVE